MLNTGTVKNDVLLLQWFGNSVTQTWFDDIWMREGFATYCGDHAQQVVLADWDVVRQAISKPVSIKYM